MSPGFSDLLSIVLEFGLYILLAALFLWPWVIVHRKAGVSAWWCAFLLIPVINVIYIYSFAFSNWPTLDGGGED